MVFRIQPHVRLQEWVAQENGFFADEGLDYEFDTSMAGVVARRRRLGERGIDGDPPRRVRGHGRRP